MDLKAPISTLPLVGPKYVQKLAKLDIKTLEDLLYHIPFRYQDFSEISKIGSFPIGETATIKGEILEFKNEYTRQGRKIQSASIYDGTGKITAVWFNQPFLARVLPPGTKLSLSGKLQWWKKQKAIYSPEYEVVTESSETIHTGRLVPVYPATAGISPKWIRSRISALLKLLPKENLNDYLPKNLNFMNLWEAVQSVHFPKSLEEAETARKRLAFDELLFIQLLNLHKKSLWQKNEPTHKLTIDKDKLQQFFHLLPFTLTSSQLRSINEILNDLSGDKPMNRLLEGDVGSGKTIVAAISAYIVYLNGFKSAIMAPTQILAQQHFETLTEIFKKTDLKVSLAGEGDIIVGTHALIHKNVKLRDVALVVIDEQHKFGVEQRTHLIHKSKKGNIAPHVLTMTATPIPRTIALTLYGELELSTLDELPKGRKKVTTWIVPPAKRNPAYAWLKDQISNFKNQIFIVCPLIEESESETLANAKAATIEFEKLKIIFKDFRIGLLHGRMKVEEKNRVLDEFRSGKIDILVTTPVVEVGVDIPNANIMLIESADRFGLASLHQLRGRIGRGDKKAYCLLFTENSNNKVLARLSALKENNSGFRLAEIDLGLRGPGEVLGTRQHGETNLKIASWQDIDLIKLSKTIALQAVANPSQFAKLHKAFAEKLISVN